MIAQHGDFRTLAPPTPARLVLSDPPYNKGFDYGPVSDRQPKIDYISMMEDFATWAFGNTADDAYLAVIHEPDFFFDHGRSIFIEHGGWAKFQRITWCYQSNIGHTPAKFTASSREIRIFRKGMPPFSAKADPEPYCNPADKRVKALIDAGSPGRAPYDWWVIDLQKNVGKDYIGYSNQIPGPLLRRLTLSLTRPGDLVADPFGGTGSTAKVAEKHGRIGWTCDLNPFAPCLNPQGVNP